MLAFALVFAALWGVLQLCALTSATRTSGAGTALLAVGTGLYFCGPVCVVLQLIYTRSRAVVTGDPLYGVVRVASWSVDPVIEEAVKVLPLVLIAWHMRTRLQWGLSDYLVIGAGLGAGFGLLEALMRFGDAGGAISIPGGWVFPGLVPPYVAHPAVSAGEWLPSPVSQGSFPGFGDGVEPFQHLIWSGLAGLGVGWFLRTRGPLRLLGTIPFALACVDHATHNHDIAGSGSSYVGDVVAAPFVALQDVRGLWPVLALGVATWFDLRVLRRAAVGRPELVDGLRAGDLVRYARLRAPWSTAVTWRFARRRRAVLLETAAGGGVPSAVADGAVDLADRLRASTTRTAWAQVRPSAAVTGLTGGWRQILRRWWALALWLLLFLPAVLAFGFGVTPAFPVVVVLFLVGLTWLVWQQIALARALRPALRSDDGAHLGHAGLRLATGTGAVGAGALVILAWLGGVGADQPLVSNFHVLDALSDLLLYGGIALVLAGLVFFPPAGLAVLSTGGIVLVPTLTTALGVTTALGLSGILLSQAVGQGSSPGPGRTGGSSSAPPPPSAPRPKPRVRHWQLHRIVEALWKGSGNPSRVGDGTTMEAARWEIRSGQLTHGQNHLVKSRDMLTRLNRWLRANEKSATRADVDWARQLQEELRDILRQVP